MRVGLIARSTEFNQGFTSIDPSTHRTTSHPPFPSHTHSHSHTRQGLHRRPHLRAAPRARPLLRAVGRRPARLPRLPPARGGPGARPVPDADPALPLLLPPRRRERGGPLPALPRRPAPPPLHGQRPGLRPRCVRACVRVSPSSLFAANGLPPLLLLKQRMASYY